MKYMVTARWWSDELLKRFGAENAVHDLTSEEVVVTIEEFGRASIKPATADRWATEGAEKILEFQNDDD